LINGDRPFRVGDTEITLSIAATPERRRRGYMYRERIEETEGLLFIFPKPEMQRFWMKNCLVPIDIAYIDNHHRVSDIHTMTPSGSDRGVGPLWTSSVPVQYALEVKDGFFERHGIRVGDTIDLTKALRHIRVR